jgi:hypothetical protein
MFTYKNEPKTWQSTSLRLYEIGCICCGTEDPVASFINSDLNQMVCHATYEGKEECSVSKPYQSTYLDFNTL